MREYKFKYYFLFLLMLILLIGGCDNEKNSIYKFTSDEEYHNYDVYGINESKDESDAFELLKNTIDINEFEEFSNQDNIEFYRSYDGESVSQIKSMLDSKSNITVIVISRSLNNEADSIAIDYILNGNRVILEYFNSGLIRKTVKIEDEIYVVENN